MTFIESMKSQGFYVKGVVPAWKESLEGVRLNCPNFGGKLFQTKFQTYIIVGFIWIMSLTVEYMETLDKM